MNVQLIGKRVLEFRNNLKLTQPELAALAGVHRNTVWDLENGRAHTIQIDTLEKVATALGVDVVALVQGATVKPSEVQK